MENPKTDEYQKQVKQLGHNIVKQLVDSGLIAEGYVNKNQFIKKFNISLVLESRDYITATTSFDINLA